MIQNEGLTGMTSNPTIFEQSISGSDLYTREIKDSLEVSPKLARDTSGSIQQANLLWHKAHRKNVMIKIPGTAEGLPAIRRCISEGININITLLFGLGRYEQVIDAYLSGLEDRLKTNKPIDGIASVASFFLSRIDVLVDPMLEKKGLQDLKGQTAIALAKKAYTIYKKAFTSPRFIALAGKGARSQRLLWASTSTKDPSFPDTKYVEALIGKDTIDTIPLETLQSFLDHGKVADTLESNLAQADHVLETLANNGIDLEEIAQRLETEGIEKFIKPYNKLLGSIEAYRTNR
jgi:transaldolase